MQVVDGLHVQAGPGDQEASSGGTAREGGVVEVDQVVTSTQLRRRGCALTFITFIIIIVIIILITFIIITVVVASC